MVARSQLRSESEGGEPSADVTDQLDCGAFRICTTLQAWQSGDLEKWRGEKYAAVASEIGNRKGQSDHQKEGKGQSEQPRNSMNIEVQYCLDTLCNDREPEATHQGGTL